MKTLLSKSIKGFSLFLIVGLVLLTSSCKKEVTNSFKIINYSGFDIQQLTFSGAISGQPIDLGNGASSQIIDLSYQRKFHVSPLLVCLEIDSFDSAGASFVTVNNRSCVPFSPKDLKNELNTIVITSVHTDSALTFEIALN